MRIRWSSQSACVGISSRYSCRILLPHTNLTYMKFRSKEFKLNVHPVAHFHNTFVPFNLVNAFLRLSHIRNVIVFFGLSNFLFALSSLLTIESLNFSCFLLHLYANRAETLLDVLFNIFVRAKMRSADTGRHSTSTYEYIHSERIKYEFFLNRFFSARLHLY